MVGIFTNIEQDKFKVSVENSKTKSEIFIKKAKKIHGDNYDYSQVKYEGSKSKVEIICPIHGSFKQIASNHLKGATCKKCSYILRANSRLLNDTEFIKRVEKVHDFRYDYSLINYQNTHGKIKIICKEHGVFEQRANDHMSGCGCPMCKKETVSNKLRSNTLIILGKCNKIHDNKYSYNFDNYTNNKSKILITCGQHGVFSQSVNSHLKGRGCPKCKNSISNPEIEIQDLLKSNGVKTICNSKKIISPLELDIYIPSLNKAIEFNGTYWHYSKKYFKPGKHAKKSNFCREKNIKLLHIREDLWLKDKEKMKKVIIKFLKYNGITKR